MVSDIKHSVSDKTESQAIYLTDTVYKGVMSNYLIPLVDSDTTQSIIGI